jgi:hypothetical protein
MQVDRRVQCEYTEQQKARIKRHKQNFINDLDDLIEDEDVKFFNNQAAIAYKIVGAYKDPKIINTMIIAPTQSGKTGSMLATIKLYLQDSENMIPVENIYIITGVSSREWVNQTKERMPLCLRDRIYHRNQLLPLFADEIKHKKNVLLIMDEVQVAAIAGQTLNKAMDLAEFNKQRMYENDIKIIEYTATPDGTIYDLMKWSDASCKFIAPTGDGYVSSFDLLQAGRVRQYKDLCGYCKGKPDDEQDYSEAIKNVEEIREDINLHFQQPMYHIIRTNKGIEQDITIQNFNKVFDFDAQVYEYTKYDGGSKHIDDINKDILEIKPEKHTFIFIKEKLRCAKSLHKKYLGILYERFSLSQDDAAIIQGLNGRDTGYDNNGESISYTNIDTIERYHKLLCSNFDDNTIRWTSKTTKYKNGLLSTKTTFNDPFLYDSDSSSRTSSASTISFTTERPVILKTQDWKEIKAWFKENPLYGKGPNRKSKDEDGFVQCITQFDKILKKRSVLEFQQYEESNKWGIRGKTEKSKEKNKYRVYPVYHDINNAESLEWWLVYYTHI